MVGLSRKRVFPKQKGTPSLVKIEHKNTATLDSARSKRNLKSQFCNYKGVCYVVPDPFGMRDVVDRNMPHSGAMVMCQKNTRISCLLI